VTGHELRLVLRWVMRHLTVFAPKL
jgi:hypothetical protein